MTGVFCDVYSGLCLNSHIGRTNGNDEELQNLAHVPSKPGRPVAECDRGIYMTVKWTQPGDDDGADITGYVIKYGGYGYFDEDRIVDYTTLYVAGNTTYFQFTDQLKEETYYQFAVAAVNTDGQGEFSEFSDYVHTWWGKQCCD